MDVAAAQEVFARRQRLGEEAINFAYTIKTRALTRLGELLRDMPKAEGTRGKGRPKLGGTQMEPPKHATTPTLADLGVTKKVAAVAQQLAALPEAMREAIAQQETTLPKVRREQKAEELRKTVLAPTAKYRVIAGCCR